MSARVLEAFMMVSIAEEGEPPIAVRRQRLALTDLDPGETAILESISLPPEDQQFLMRIGLVPGVRIGFSRSAPMGDPSVYSVDGTQIALRLDTARSITVLRDEMPPAEEEA